MERLAGKVALLENRPKEAASAFDREAQWHRSNGQTRAMVGALIRSGDALARTDDASGAVDHYYRAARSLMALKEFPRAAELLELARPLATGLEKSRKTLLENLSRELSGRREGAAQ